MKSIFLKKSLNYFQHNCSLSIFAVLKLFKSNNVLKNCGVMKSLADMPSCLGGEDNRINIA